MVQIWANLILFSATLQTICFFFPQAPLTNFFFGDPPNEFYFRFAPHPSRWLMVDPKMLRFGMSRATYETCNFYVLHRKWHFPSHKKINDATWRWCEPICFFLRWSFTVFRITTGSGRLLCWRYPISTFRDMSYCPVNFGQVTEDYGQNIIMPMSPSSMLHRWAQKIVEWAWLLDQCLRFVTGCPPHPYLWEVVKIHLPKTCYWYSGLANFSPPLKGWDWIRTGLCPSVGLE